MRVQISIVNMVEDELKIDVNELISAANITANMRPVKPARNCVGYNSCALKDIRVSSIALN